MFSNDTVHSNEYFFNIRKSAIKNIKFFKENNKKDKRGKVGLSSLECGLEMETLYNDKYGLTDENNEVSKILGPMEYNIRENVDRPKRFFSHAEDYVQLNMKEHFNISFIEYMQLSVSEVEMMKEIAHMENTRISEEIQKTQNETNDLAKDVNKWKEKN